ncbi:MAG: hypothetical protein H7A43_09905 [Verrucomicrobia bacterium]|nr:hypothetical protein [Verrucomicrobiota bacterium]
MRRRVVAAGLAGWILGGLAGSTGALEIQTVANGGQSVRLEDLLATNVVNVVMYHAAWSTESVGELALLTEDLDALAGVRLLILDVVDARTRLARDAEVAKVPRFSVYDPTLHLVRSGLTLAIEVAVEVRSLLNAEPGPARPDR